VEAVRGEIAGAIVGMEAEDQAEIDAALISLTGRRIRAGLAPTRSSASAWPRPRPPRTRAGLPLYRYVGGVSAQLLPVPDDEHHQWR
jgi:enolase